LSDKQEVVSEREAFLLRHLQIMLVEEKLIGSQNDVVVIPARNAWTEYHDVHAYVCQAERLFQPVDYIAFYSSNQIHPIIPKIEDVHETVLFTHGVMRAGLG
jgi:hypothetical protein